jgi:hypothetical protein
VIVCGRQRRNRFLVDYEEDPEFRRFILGKIRGGALMRKQAAALVGLPRPRPPAGPSFCPAHPPANPPPPPPQPDPEHEALVKRGRALFAEYHDGDPADEWWFWW